MNLLPIRLLLVAGLVTLFFTAFTKKTIPRDAPHPTEAARQVILYWYTFPYDFYNDYKTIAQEEYELWAMYGYPVDQVPGGGTLLMKGYLYYGTPHLPPSALLYGHFPFMIDGPGKPAK